MADNQELLKDFLEEYKSNYPTFYVRNRFTGAEYRVIKVAGWQDYYLKLVGLTYWANYNDYTLSRFIIE